MSYDLFIALCLFAFVSSITPGPNNIMLLSSGMNYGFKKTIPHMLGIAIGFTLMIFLVGLGLDKLFLNYPILHMILKVVSGIYMFYLAWKIAHSAPFSNEIKSGLPMTFIEAALFQWINPKAWVMAISAIVTYVPVKENFSSLLIVTLTFGAINLPAIGIWALFGTHLRIYFTNPKTLKAFNYLMALLLILSLFPLLKMNPN